MKHGIALAFMFCLIAVTAPAQTAIPPEGTGSDYDPYRIASVGNLYWMSQNSSSWEGSFIQTADIDADSTQYWDEGRGFLPIGSRSNWFTGYYNGAGHTISHLHINRPSSGDIGLFGFLGGKTVDLGYFKYFQGSEVDSLGVCDAEIVGGSCVGIIAGYALGNIAYCYSTGTSSGAGILGSLEGGNTSGGEGAAGNVGYSYTRATVYGSSDPCQLVGSTYKGIIRNSYSVGGVVGFATEGTSYACFYTTDSCSASGLGIGKTTAEMKLKSTYLDAGWNPDHWCMDPDFNDGYPYLKYQRPTGTPLPVELVAFTATVSANTAELRWTTASEVNCAGFEIERRSLRVPGGVDGPWETIGAVNVSGTSNSPKTYTFSDKELPVGTHAYRLKQVDKDGSFQYFGAVEAVIAAPADFVLYENYPNPFNPSTTIRYDVPDGSSQYVSLKVYDPVGREVATLVNEQKAPGAYSVRFDASRLPSGTYFCRLAAGNFTAVKKLMLVK